jgi:PAS domain S-box-containing protein
MEWADVDEPYLGLEWNNLQSFVDSLDDVLVVIGPGFRILQTNAAAVRSTGRPSSELMGHTCYTALHNRATPCDALEDGCPVAEVWHTGRPARVLRQHFDAAGILHITEVTASPLSAEQSPLVLERVRDVTAQVRTAPENERLLEETRRARDELDAFFNTIPDAIHIINADYRVVKANLGGALLQGLSLDEIIGRPCFEVFHDLDEPCEGCLVTQTLATGRPGRATHSRLRADGSRVVTDVFTYPLFDGRGRVFQVLEYARDVTERVHLQEELAHKARQLQHLLTETINVQEEERARIAREMHDGVTQLLIGALYETQAARELLRGTSHPALVKLERAQDLLNQVEGETRRVISDLHPPILDAIGLEPALKRHIASFQETFGLSCALHVIGLPFRLPGATELAVYRIVQEALHNVETHAHAQSASVTLNFQTDLLRVVIEDDGQGFNPREVMNEPGDHFGLPSMFERAQSIGARLQVNSRPSRGTRIILTVPSESGSE